MDFLFGYWYGKNSEKSSGGIFSSIIVLFILYMAYKDLEKYLVDKFTDNLLQMFIGLVFLTILIFRYSFKSSRATLSRGLIEMILILINIPLSIIFSIVFFNHIGFTPFSLLIKWWHLSNWHTYEILECIGDIMWFVFKVLDILCTITGVYYIQKFIFLFVNNDY